jgi:hypothetical protein
MGDTRKSRAVVNYWHKHYSGCGFCELCGNCGVIDARSAKLAGGDPVGRLHWCICPNGQSRRKSNAGMRPVELIGHSRVVLESDHG